MSTGWEIEKLNGFGSALAFHGMNAKVSFDELVAHTRAASKSLAEAEIEAGATCIVSADFSPQAIALMLALYRNDNIVVPLYDPRQERSAQVSELVAARYVLSPGDGALGVERREVGAPAHPLVAKLRADREPGLVLISSGSTGKPKAMLLSLRALFDRYRELAPRPSTALTFLLFDHIGGFNTLFHTLFSGGTLVPLRSRNVEEVCAAIEQCKVEVVPTTPTFLNMLLMSRAYERYNLSSMKLITYGTEVMPESTLKRLAQVFPRVRLKQTYGMSEIGILSTRSDESTSLWIRIGKDVQHKVVDGVLWLKSRTAMLGYLNAESPFDADGWLCTGDLVEQNGEQYRILGRKENIINVGGLKVYPAEIESQLLQHEGVRDALAWGKRNAVTGQVVAVKVRVEEGKANLDEFADVLRRYCRAHLDDYKVPRHFDFTTEPIHTSRFKKMSAVAERS